MICCHKLTTGISAAAAVGVSEAVSSGCPSNFEESDHHPDEHMKQLRNQVKDLKGKIAMIKKDPRQLCQISDAELVESGSARFIKIKGRDYHHGTEKCEAIIPFKNMEEFEKILVGVKEYTLIGLNETNSIRLCCHVYLVGSS